MSILGYGIKGFYCCGELKSVTLTLHDEVNASHDGNAKNCCGTKVQYFKVKDNHIASDNFNTPPTFSTEAGVIASSFKPSLLGSEKAINAYHSNGPPRGNFTPIFILNCNFQI